MATTLALAFLVFGAVAVGSYFLALKGVTANQDLVALFEKIDNVSFFSLIAVLVLRIILSLAGAAGSLFFYVLLCIGIAVVLACISSRFFLKGLKEQLNIHD